jgi:outer membrane protein assembly factor BamB
VEWVSNIPGTGWSSPIVWDGRVFVTTASSEKEMKSPSLGVDFSNDYVAELTNQGKTDDEVEKLVTARDTELPDEIELTYSLFCIEIESGQVLWQRDFFVGAPPVGRHRKNSYTSETPVTDGERVYVYVAFLGLYAFDFEGNQVWSTPLEPKKVYLDFGSGASPALFGNQVIILSDNEEQSYLAAFDRRTGKPLWRTTRTDLGSEQIRSGWSTPFVWDNELRVEIVAQGPGAVVSYDLDGRELWRMGRMSLMSIQSPSSWGGLLYVTAGSARESNKPIAAIRPGATGDITPGEKSNRNQFVVWYNRAAGGTYLPTPVIYDGGLYALSDKGIFSRYDAKTGEQTYRSRIHKTARNFTSSPWAYNHMVFCINEEGYTFVIKAGKEFELLSINALEGFTLATPAIAGDRLLIRTQNKLYSIRNLSGSGNE